MKLSQMSTEQAMDVLCEITPYISNIAIDEELLAELKRTIDPKQTATKAELYAKGAEKLTKITPLILKKHKADAFGILAALNGKTVDEIAGQNIVITMKQIWEIAKDKELMSFFKSSTASEGNE